MVRAVKVGVTLLTMLALQSCAKNQNYEGYFVRSFEYLAFVTNPSDIYDKYDYQLDLGPFQYLLLGPQLEWVPSKQTGYSVLKVSIAGSIKECLPWPYRDPDRRCMTLTEVYQVWNGPEVGLEFDKLLHEWPRGKPPKP